MESHGINRFQRGVSGLASGHDLNDVASNAATHRPVPTAIDDILSEIVVEAKKPKARAVNFYLSAEVIAAIDELAATRNVSKSKLVDAVLRRTLIE